MVEADTLNKTRTDATAIFKAGIKAVAPDEVIKNSCYRENDELKLGDSRLNLNHFQNIYVIGAGKATAPMASAIEELLHDRIKEGVIIVKYGHTRPLRKIKTVEAGHPVPDRNGMEGSRQIMGIAEKAGNNDLVICLISGGGSALLSLPVDGVSLEDNRVVTDTLLSCGANIHEMNTIRKHLSAIKGGRLAVAACPATIVSLILSDVVGDDLDVIASGPTVPDTSTFNDCIRIIDKYQILEKLPEPVRNHFTAASEGKAEETPKKDHPAFHKTKSMVIGCNYDAITAAGEEAKKRGYSTLILSSYVEGETESVAKVHAAIARQIHETGQPVSAPACILSGGETTVTLKGNGKGGRNQQFVLCCVRRIAGPFPTVILSGGTDGNDGPTDAAGAIADNLTLEKADGKNLKIDDYLKQNDSYHFFQKLNDLVITGPTNTNVMDIRLILIPGLT